MKPEEKIAILTEIVNVKQMKREDRLVILREIISHWDVNTWYCPSRNWAMGGYIHRSGISNLTARRDLDCLVEDGFLERRLGGKGWFVYYEYKRRLNERTY
jgi:hypothetical protein